MKHTPGPETTETEGLFRGVYISCGFAAAQQIQVQPAESNNMGELQKCPKTLLLQPSMCKEHKVAASFLSSRSLQKHTLWLTFITDIEQRVF